MQGGMSVYPICVQCCILPHVAVVGDGQRHVASSSSTCYCHGSTHDDMSMMPDGRSTPGSTPGRPGGALLSIFSRVSSNQVQRNTCVPAAAGQHHPNPGWRKAAGQHRDAHR